MTIANLLFAFKYLDHIYNWYEYLLVGSLVLSAIMLYLIFFIKVFEIKNILSLLSYKLYLLSQVIFHLVYLRTLVHLVNKISSLVFWLLICAYWDVSVT